MSETPWVETLQPGDKVTVVSGCGGSLSIRTVVRVTPKQIVVRERHGGEIRFWKKDLHEVGVSGPFDFSATICKTTQEHRDRIRRSNLLHVLRYRCDAEKFTPEVVEKVYAILDEAGAIKKRGA